MDESVDHKLREMWRELVLIKTQAEEQTSILREIAKNLQLSENYGERYILDKQNEQINLHGQLSENINLQDALANVSNVNQKLDEISFIMNKSLINIDTIGEHSVINQLQEIERGVLSTTNAVDDFHRFFLIVVLGIIAIFGLFAIAASVREELRTAHEAMSATPAGPAEPSRP